MDSITQAALGATVAFAVSGNRVSGNRVSGNRMGRKALVAGALIGTLPDLDVLVPYDDAVDNFTYHRSWSHSFFVLTLATPVIAWLTAAALRIRGGAQKLDRNLLLMVWLVLITHTLLDCFTVYGTQFFWPLSDYPVGWGSIFIIDPLFTLPLLVGIYFAARVGEKPANRQVKPVANNTRPVLLALSFSVAYLILTMAIQHTIIDKARQSLSRVSFDADAVSVLPSPGSLLWRVVARSDDNYLEGFYSLFDTFEPVSNPITFTSHTAGEELLLPLENYLPVQRLQWFTKGLYATSVVDDKLVISDLRMGIEAQYVFRFDVGRVIPGGAASDGISEGVSDSDGVTNGVSGALPAFGVEPMQPTVLRRFQPDIPRMKKLLRRVIRQPQQAAL